MRFPAFLERLLLPGMGHCYRCKRPWRQGPIGVQEHVTLLSDSRGVFPLCEDCWAKLTPEQRLPYYRQKRDRDNHAGFWVELADGTWQEWPHPESWPVMEEAVLREQQ